MDTFEELLEKERVSVGRFVKFRIPVQEDAEDVLQEVFLTAYQKFSQLKNRSAFKAWLLSIARNKCNDYFIKYFLKDFRKAGIIKSVCIPHMGEFWEDASQWMPRMIRLVWILP